MQTKPHNLFFRSMARGLKGKCPHCGDGKLFWRYLKVEPRCQACGRVYWRGAHSQRLARVVDAALETVAAAGRLGPGHEGEQPLAGHQRGWLAR